MASPHASASARARGGGPFLRYPEFVRLQEHLRQVREHVRLAGVSDVTHRYGLEEPLQARLQGLGHRDSVQVVAERLVVVPVRESAVAPKTEARGLVAGVAEQFAARPDGPGRENPQGSSGREIPDEVGDGKARCRCDPPAVPVPAELHLQARPRNAQLVAHLLRHVAGRSEEIRARIHEETVHSFARQTPSHVFERLEQDGLDTVLPEGVSGTETGRSSPDDDDLSWMHGLSGWVTDDGTERANS